VIVKSSGSAYFSEMIDANIKVIKAKIDALAAPRRVQLMAVSKTQPQGAIEAALKAGQRLFGENRVAEAAAKFSALREAYKDIELHLIGPLQTNKVAHAVALFDVIQTLDRPKLAQALAKEMERQGRAPRFYIEVNIGREPQKAGLMEEEVPAFLARCRKEWGLEVEGLMAIPPQGENPLPFFEAMKKLAEKTGIQKLSMGMSGDYPQAIACGATMVRIGTALFGARKKP
jgi:pyridoxal phosphate enzyme (YggS family)